MRVFFSYGHDRNKPLVERIRRDVEGAGFDVWIDGTELKAGDDWRRRIFEALQQTDWVLAFLSKHSTRDPGVCLDEIAIALGVRGGIVSTVLVEDAGEVRPPVTLSNIQWLDMHDWEQRQSGDRAAFEAWYHQKLKAILDLLASDRARTFAGEIEELDVRLHPASQASDVAVLVAGFVGRTWLVNELEAWRRGAGASRVFALTGDPGSGKSAFAAWLAHHGKANVISLNLCRYNIEDRRDAAKILRTLAFQVATRLPDYRLHLLRKLKLHDPDGGVVIEKEPAALFEWLLLEPLRSLVDGGRRDDRYLLIVDALDETIVAGRSALAEVLAADAHRLPDWVALLVSSRPETVILNAFAGVSKLSIGHEQAANRDDLRSYAQAWLSGQTAGAETEDLLERIVVAADGNFLYLCKLREAVENGLVRLDDSKGTPPGLQGLFFRWFERRFPTSADYERVATLLSVLAAATHPVPEDLLTEMFAWTIRDRARLLGELDGLFERRPEGVAPFHKSLRDWLLDEHAAGLFVVDADAGRGNLIRALCARFKDLAAAPIFKLPDRFILAELPSLADTDTALVLGACGGAQKSRLVAYGCSIAAFLRESHELGTALAWLQFARRIAAGAEIPALIGGWVSEGEIRHRLGRNGEALASYRAGQDLALGLVARYPLDTDCRRGLAECYHRIGDVAQEQGDLAAALASYRTGMETVRRLVAQEPKSALFAQDLSVSLNRIGDVHRATGDNAAAEASYVAAMEIVRRLMALDPSDIDLLRDGAVSLERIGELQQLRGEFAAAFTSFDLGRDMRQQLTELRPADARAHGDLATGYDSLGGLELARGDDAAALAAYSKGMEIRQRVSGRDPDDVDFQRGLAVSNLHIGDVHEAQGNHTAALASYGTAIEILQRLLALDPDNTGRQRDVAVALTKVGVVLEAQGELPASLRAYRDSMGRTQRLVALSPNNVEWQRDLGVCYERIGNLQRAQADFPAALASYREAMEITRSLLARDPKIALWLRDLSISHYKIGNVQRAQNDLTAALSSYRQGIEIGQRLLALDPENAEWQYDLSVTFEQIGDVQELQGDLASALASYRSAAGIRQRLLERVPDNVRWLHGIRTTLLKVAMVLLTQGDKEAAREALSRTRAVAERVARLQPNDPQAAASLRLAEDLLGQLDRIE